MGPFEQNGTVKWYFLSLISGMRSKTNVCGSWTISQTSLTMKASPPSPPCLPPPRPPSSSHSESLSDKLGLVYSPTTDSICVRPPGAGSLRAKFELSKGPSSPSTLAVQFMNEGSTLSGVDMELQGSGYRLSLNKKRFATGTRRSLTLQNVLRHHVEAKCSRFSRLCLLRALHGRLLRRPVTPDARDDRCSPHLTILDIVNFARITLTRPSANFFSPFFFAQVAKKISLQ